MPWRETSPMDQRRLFINDHRHSVFPFTELCARYGISRKTGYKWIARFEGGGYPALAEISRRSRSDRLDLPALCRIIADILSQTTPKG
jgi:transposase